MEENSTVPAIVEVKNTKLNLIRVSPKYGEINVFSPYLIHGDQIKAKYKVFFGDSVL